MKHHLILLAACAALLPAMTQAQTPSLATTPPLASTPAPRPVPFPLHVSPRAAAPPSKALLNPIAPDVEAQQVNNLIAVVNQGITSEAQQVAQLWTGVWANSKGISPDAIVAKMGNQASAFFTVFDAKLAHVQASAAAVGKSASDYLAAQVQNKPRTVKHNADGTVTLGPVTGP